MRYSRVIRIEYLQFIPDALCKFFVISMGAVYLQSRRRRRHDELPLGEINDSEKHLQSELSIFLSRRDS